jgi:hypothetical protein
MGHAHNHNGQGTGRHVKLAPGTRLSCVAQPSAATLVLADGKVHLNEHALAIFELCDGSRSRNCVVIDAMLQIGGGVRASDVVEFLDAAEARGWIVDIE